MSLRSETPKRTFHDYFLGYADWIELRLSATRAKRRNAPPVVGLVFVNRGNQLRLHFQPFLKVSKRELLEAANANCKAGEKVLGTFESEPILEPFPRGWAMLRSRMWEYKLIFDVNGCDAALWWLDGPARSPALVRCPLLIQRSSNGRYVRSDRPLDLLFALPRVKAQIVRGVRSNVGELNTISKYVDKGYPANLA